MDIALLSDTRKIIEEVKDKTGKDIIIRKSSSLNTYAIAKTARSSMPSHIIDYNPVHSNILNYIIAHECGHMIRIYEEKNENRLMPYSDGGTMGKAVIDIENNIKISYPLETRKKLYPLWVHEIITQLTGMPEDVRIEKWIFDNYPELRQSQQDTLVKQSNDIQGVTRHEIKEMTPEFLYNGSGIINLFYIKSINNIIGPAALKTLKKAGFYEKGIELYSGITEIMKKENSLANSIEITNYLAKNLGFEEWFKWIDFEDIRTGYEDAIV